MMQKIIGICCAVFLFSSVAGAVQAAGFYVDPAVANPEPWLYMTHGDVVADKSNVYAGLGYDKKVLLTNNTGSVFRYQDGAINTVGNGGSMGSANSMFISAAGAVFVSWPSGIWRSSNNGDSWTKTLTFPRTDGRTIAFAQDNQGNIYVGQYSLQVSTGAALLYKSSDDGATWTNITPAVFAAARHIHYVYWCPFRNKLFVAIGDPGNSAVYVSGDYGATFSLWGSAEQTVAIVSDQNYIYGVRDTAGSRFIWRATDDGQQKDVFDLAQSAIGWWGHRDEYGNIIFAISRDGDTQSDIIASPDQGEHWKNYYTKRGKYLDRFALPSYYYDKWDGFYYGGGGLFVSAKWRLYPGQAQLKIADDGIDYLNDGIKNPWKTFSALNYLPLDNLSSIKIDSHAAADDDALIISSDNIAVNGNGTTLNAAPIFSGFSNNLEGSSPFNSLTQTNGTVTISAIDSPHSGAKSLVARSSAANGVLYANKNIGPYDEGDTVWMSGWVNIPNNITSTGYFDIFRLWNQSGGASLVVKVLNNKNISVKLENVGRTYSVLQSVEPFEVFPIGQWVKLKVKVKVSDTTGTITIWQNDKIIMQAVGLDTLRVGKPWTSARWGVYANQPDALVYWDDIALGNADPERAAAINVTGDYNTVSNFNFGGSQLAVSGYGNLINNNTFDSASSAVTVASGDIIASTVFTVGNLAPNTPYEVYIDNGASTLVAGDACSGAICNSDSSGKIIFTYSGAGAIAHLIQLRVYYPTNVYYIDNISGNDNNFGHSSDQAWKTIVKINTSVFQAGDKILFKKGQTWRETLTPRSSGTAENPIVFGAYGEGEKPRITGGDIIGSWTLQSGNIWSSAVATKPLRVAINDALGLAVPSLNQLNASGQWFWSSNVLYVYSATDANLLSIEAGKRANAVNTNGRSNIVLDGFILDLANGSSGAGVWIAGAGTSKVAIKNCEIRWNRHGVVFFTADRQAGNHLIDNCAIHDNEAHGIFPNAGSDGSSPAARTVISNNTIYNNKVLEFSFLPAIGWLRIIWFTAMAAIAQHRVIPAFIFMAAEWARPQPARAIIISSGVIPSMAPDP